MSKAPERLTFTHLVEVGTAISKRSAEIVYLKLYEIVGKTSKPFRGRLVIEDYDRPFDIVCGEWIREKVPPKMIGQLESKFQVRAFGPKGKYLFGVTFICVDEEASREAEALTIRRDATAAASALGKVAERLRDATVAHKKNQIIRDAWMKRHVPISRVLRVAVENGVPNDWDMGNIEQFGANGWIITTVVPLFDGQAIRSLIYTLHREVQVDLSKIIDDEGLRALGLPTRMEKGLLAAARQLDDAMSMRAQQAHIYACDNGKDDNPRYYCPAHAGDLPALQHSLALPAGTTCVVCHVPLAVYNDHPVNKAIIGNIPWTAESVEVQINDSTVWLNVPGQGCVFRMDTMNAMRQRTKGVSLVDIRPASVEGRERAAGEAREARETYGHAYRMPSGMCSNKGCCAVIGSIGCKRPCPYTVEQSLEDGDPSEPATTVEGLDELRKMLTIPCPCGNCNGTPIPRKGLVRLVVWDGRLKELAVLPVGDIPDLSAWTDEAVRWVEDRVVTATYNLPREERTAYFGVTGEDGDNLTMFRCNIRCQRDPVCRIRGEPADVACGTNLCERHALAGQPDARQLFDGAPGLYRQLLQEISTDRLVKLRAYDYPFDAEYPGDSVLDIDVVILKKDGHAPPVLAEATLQTIAACFARLARPGVDQRYLVRGTGKSDGLVLDQVCTVPAPHWEETVSAPEFCGFRHLDKVEDWLRIVSPDNISRIILSRQDENGAVRDVFGEFPIVLPDDVDSQKPEDRLAGIAVSVLEWIVATMRLGMVNRRATPIHVSGLDHAGKPIERDTWFTCYVRRTRDPDYPSPDIALAASAEDLSRASEKAVGL